MSASLLVRLETTRTQGDVVWVNPQHVSFVKTNPVHLGGGSVVYMVTSSRDNERPHFVVVPGLKPDQVVELLNTIPSREPRKGSRIW